MNPKKAKKKPTDRPVIASSTASLSPRPELVLSRRAVVHTEEEENALYEDNDNNDDADADNNIVLSAEDEADETAEDELVPSQKVQDQSAMVHKLAYKIIHSTNIVLPAWHGIQRDLSEPQTLMPRDVATWWNSTFDMLNYALEHREAVDAITQRRDLGLRKYELEDNEWVILQQLRDILKILKDATLYFSHATPNLATVIPAMDHVNKTLTSFSRNKKYLPSIRSAVSAH
ncbi:hypothetical protein DFJ58DRAFT_733175 [Suillus subalutaceus]|uniref:uncharacterized protein n=1 Tax=Suillus subalutaceus TaxID=48586 RepID=UPI001B862C41|nr:uncharacterized protein DFJ58DRAFT_733175 [Suillus subalutaceus]KAG1839727.1 hypothetical protein DFJ58DRAFT_733175 [Suillus subalutaceus]